MSILEYVLLFAGIASISQVVRSLLTQKRAPPDEFGLTDPKTIFSRRFQNWNASLRKAKVIPDVLPTDVPHPLTVVYFDDNLEFGTRLEYHRVDLCPVDLDWLPHEGEYYTVVMTDADFPDPKNPIEKEYLHWMVTNTKDAFVKSGETVAQYIPPSNKHAIITTNRTCKGIHRVVFVVYKHLKGKINVPASLYTPEDDLDHVDVIPHNREKFSSKDFAKKYDLIPFAANYFTMNMDIVEEDYND